MEMNNNNDHNRDDEEKRQNKVPPTDPAAGEENPDTDREKSGANSVSKKREREVIYCSDEEEPKKLRRDPSVYVTGHNSKDKPFVIDDSSSDEEEEEEEQGGQLVVEEEYDDYFSGHGNYSPGTPVDWVSPIQTMEDVTPPNSPYFEEPEYVPHPDDAVFFDGRGYQNQFDMMTRCMRGIILQIIGYLDDTSLRAFYALKYTLRRFMRTEVKPKFPWTIGAKTFVRGKLSSREQHGFKVGRLSILLSHVLCMKVGYKSYLIHDMTGTNYTPLNCLTFEGNKYAYAPYVYRTKKTIRIQPMGSTLGIPSMGMHTGDMDNSLIEILGTKCNFMPTNGDTQRATNRNLILSGIIPKEILSTVRDVTPRLASLFVESISSCRQYEWNHSDTLVIDDLGWIEILVVGKTVETVIVVRQDVMEVIYDIQPETKHIFLGSTLGTDWTLDSPMGMTHLSVQRCDPESMVHMSNLTHLCLHNITEELIKNLPITLEKLTVGRMSYSEYGSRVLTANLSIKNQYNVSRHPMIMFDWYNMVRMEGINLPHDELYHGRLYITSESPRECNLSHLTRMKELVIGDSCRTLYLPKGLSLLVWGTRKPYSLLDALRENTVVDRYDLRIVCKGNIDLVVMPTTDLFQYIREGSERIVSRGRLSPCDDDDVQPHLSAKLYVHPFAYAKKPTHQGV